MSKLSAFVPFALLLLLCTSSCEDVVAPHLVTNVDTIYVDRGNVSLVDVQGSVRLTRNCVTRVYHHGMRVSIPELGVSTLTDSLGRYYFTNVPNRQLMFEFRKEGFYPYSHSLIPSLNDSGHSLASIELAAFNDWSGEYKEDTTMQYAPVYELRDTLLTDASGIHYWTKTGTFLRDGYTIIFRLTAIDEAGQQGGYQPVLLIAKTPEINTLDSTTDVMAIRSYFRDWDYSPILLHTDTLESLGIKSGDTYYVTATSIACGASGFGSRHGQVRKYIRP